MNIKEYIKENKISIASISKETHIPYTTVSELINGKVNIDKTGVGVALKIAQVCNLEFEDFYDLCKAKYTDNDEYEIITKNKRYYIHCNIDNKEIERYIFKVTELNKIYIEDAAKWEYDSIIKEYNNSKEIAEVNEWEVNTI